ncbi:MAG TPA: DUF433 domain-containing protein [Candidatus Lokiarchaeia archaeon]|nr:DUF433 domain-containing protein [Candidatus Lokiarchaeia archaeon]
MVSIIESDPDVLGGMPVIKGTRIPVSFIFDLVRLEYTVDQIIDFYPSLTREMVLQVLELGKDMQERLQGVDFDHYLEKELVQS